MRTLLFLAVLIASTAAQAASITVQYTGTVTGLGSLLTSDFSLGESVVYTATIDTTDTQPGNTTFGSYTASNLTMVIGGDYVITSTTGVATVNDDFGGSADLFLVAMTAATSPLLAAGPVGTVDLQLNFDDLAFPSDAFPLALPFGLVTNDVSNVNFGGTLPENRLDWEPTSAVVVPEPSTGLLLLTGFGALARRQRA